MRLKRLCWGLLAVFLLGAVAYAADTLLTVQLKKAAVRQKPHFMGKIMKSLAYGDKVTVVSTSGAWSKVRLDDGREGWMHNTAVTNKKLKLKAGHAVGANASQAEMALAGRGFNSDVESAYKSGGRLDYTVIDTMESGNIFEVTADDSAAFLSAGELKPDMGGK